MSMRVLLIAVFSTFLYTHSSVYAQIEHPTMLIGAGVATGGFSTAGSGGVVNVGLKRGINATIAVTCQSPNRDALLITGIQSSTYRQRSDIQGDLRKVSYTIPFFGIGFFFLAPAAVFVGANYTIWHVIDWDIDTPIKNQGGISGGLIFQSRKLWLATTIHSVNALVERDEWGRWSRLKYSGTQIWISGGLAFSLKPNNP